MTIGINLEKGVSRAPSQHVSTTAATKKGKDLQGSRALVFDHGTYY